MGEGMDNLRSGDGDFVIDSIGVWKTANDDLVVLTEIWGGQAAMGYFVDMPHELRLWDRSTGWLLEKGKGIDNPSGDDRATLVTWVGDSLPKPPSDADLLAAMGLGHLAPMIEPAAAPAPVSNEDALAAMGLSFLLPAQTEVSPVPAGEPFQEAEPQKEETVSPEIKERWAKATEEVKSEIGPPVSAEGFTLPIVEIPLEIHQALLGVLGLPAYRLAHDTFRKLRETLLDADRGPLVPWWNPPFLSECLRGEVSNLHTEVARCGVVSLTRILNMLETKNVSVPNPGHPEPDPPERDAPGPDDGTGHEPASEVEGTTGREAGAGDYSEARIVPYQREVDRGAETGAMRPAEDVDAESLPRPDPDRDHPDRNAGGPEGEHPDVDGHPGHGVEE